jgi:hypothetical protein
MARQRVWVAWSGGGTASTTVQDLDIGGGTRASGTTVQRVVGILDVSWYATSAQPRVTDYEVGIHTGTSAIAPSVTNANASPGPWMFFLHRRLSRTIAGADASEYRWAIQETPIDVQGMRDVGGVKLHLVFRRVVADASDNRITWLAGGRSLLLLP